MTKKKANRITQKKFKDVLKNSGGNQSTIAKAIGVSRSAITHFLNKYTEMRKLLEAEAERIIDVAENVVDHDIVKNRNVDTAKWKLNNSKRGKQRGYGIKQELEMSGEIKTSAKELHEEIKRERADNKRSHKK